VVSHGEWVRKPNSSYCLGMLTVLGVFRLVRKPILLLLLTVNYYLGSRRPRLGCFLLHLSSGHPLPVNEGSLFVSQLDRSSDNKLPSNPRPVASRKNLLETSIVASRKNLFENRSSV